MNRKKSKKIFFIFIGLLVIFFIIYYAESEMISSIKSEITNSSLNLTIAKNERNSKIETLSSIQSQLEENNSKLQQLKSGDKYNLHDPTMQEVTDFLNTNKGESIGSSPINLINQSKNQGIRCAYVIVYLENGGTEQLIGFDTIDEGMVCFEPGVSYKIIPKIGNTFGECRDENSFVQGPNVDISDIVVIGLNGCEEEPSTNTDTTPVITSFYIEPTSIEAWETAELHWVISNARSVSIDNGIGYVGSTGSRVITPETTTTYTLTATNGDGVMYATAQVVVNQIDYSELIIGTWDLVEADHWQGSFYRIVFNSNNTCIIYDTVSGQPYTWKPVRWSVEDNILSFYNIDGYYWGGLSWTLSYDGTLLSITNKPFPIIGYGGTYIKV